MANCGSVNKIEGMKLAAHRAAGIYGLIARSPMYFMDEKINRELLPAITDPE